MKYLDKKFMKLALKLANKANPSPNPKVGCVITKYGFVKATGFHKKAGMPHAEIIALGKLNFNAKGCTLYINLEPCCHHGKTPPCVDKIIAAGIKRVVIAMKDPYALVNGRTIEILRENGIDVDIGLMENKAKKLNKVFIKYITQRMPYVILKSAVSLDGKIATKKGESKWISNEKARDVVHMIRNDVDAVLVGINTVIKDNPSLSSRFEKEPLRIIVDNKLRIPLKAKVLKDENVVIATSKKYNKRKKKLLEKSMASVIIAGEEKVDMKLLMKQFAKMGISTVLIEGGGEINASAFEAKIVDKVIFFISPKIIGGKTSISSVAGKGIDKLSDAIKLKNIKFQKIDDNVMIVGDVK